jgi:hypothetical protein
MYIKTLGEVKELLTWIN